MKYTVNYNLKKPEGTDVVNIDDFNSNADILDTKINFLNEQIDTLETQEDSLSAQINNLAAYAVANGTNTYIATISGYTLIEGQTVRIKFTNANTGASTLNINSLGLKNIVKGNGSALSGGNIKAGQICNLVYNGLNFQLLGEGGEYGTAISSDVLLGKTIGTDSGITEGTMPNRGTVNQNLTTEGQEFTIPSGYHNGLGKIKAVITGLIASVIKMEATVGGVAGNFTSDATATAAQMLSGAIAYVKGNKIIGAILSKTAQTYTPGTTNQVISANQYLSGDQTILGSPNFVEGNIKDGVNMWGKVGNLKGVVLKYDTINTYENENLINLLKKDTSHELYGLQTIIKFKVNFSGTFSTFITCRKSSNQNSAYVSICNYINGVLVNESDKLWCNDSMRFGSINTAPISVNIGDIYEMKLRSDPVIWVNYYDFRLYSRIIDSVINELVIT